MSFQKTFSALFCALLIVGSLPGKVQAVMPLEAYEDAIAALIEAKIIDPGADVRPYSYVNRAEALKLIIRARNDFLPEVVKVSQAMPAMSLFPDVSQAQWYAPYLEVGFKYGLVKGFPDGRFWPSAGVRVSEAVSMLARAFEGQNVSSAAFLSSEDLPNREGEWYSGAVSTVLARGAVMPLSQLRTGAYMTRGELMDMIYRMRVAYGETAPTSGVAQIHVAPIVQAPVAAVQPSTPQHVPPIATVSSPQASTPHASDPVAQQFASTKPFAISIPSLGIQDLTITHPADTSTQKGVLEVLKHGVGHLFGNPGEGGKIMIYGHSSGYPWDLSKFTKIFRTINKTAIGDRVYVTKDGKLHVYEVKEKRTIPAADKTPFEPDDEGEELILYTCWPPDSISHRYLVVAKPVQTIALR